MVSDANAPRSDPSRADSDETTYDVVYRATRDAVWDVVGTATLILFYLALAAVGLSLAYAGLVPALTGSASYAAAGVGLVALAVGAFAAYRVYALTTE